MSTVNGLNAYSNSLYLYSLYSSNNDSGTSARQSSLQNSLTGGSTSILSRLTGSTSTQSLTEQISGLVRLTRYAMDSMGLGSDSRVTFSRLKEYCEQVQEQFSTSVTEGLEAARADLGTATFSMNAKGEVAVHSTSQLTESLAELGLAQASGEVAELQKNLLAAGVDLSKGFSFSFDEDGTLTALGESAKWQSALDANNVSAFNLVSVIANQGIDPSIAFTLKSNSDMSVSVNTGNSEYKKALQAFYDLRKQAQKNGLQDMTLDEINEEIRLARLERKNRK